MLRFMMRVLHRTCVFEGGPETGAALRYRIRGGSLRDAELALQARFCIAPRPQKPHAIPDVQTWQERLRHRPWLRLREIRPAPSSPRGESLQAEAAQRSRLASAAMPLEPWVRVGTEPVWRAAGAAAVDNSGRLDFSAAMQNM